MEKCWSKKIQMHRFRLTRTNVATSNASTTHFTHPYNNQVDDMNKTLGTDFTGKSTVSEGFAGWYGVLAKMYIKHAHQAL